MAKPGYLAAMSVTLCFFVDGQYLSRLAAALAGKVSRYN
jgi:hypothetical protein